MMIEDRGGKSLCSNRVLPVMSPAGSQRDRLEDRGRFVATLEFLFEVFKQEAPSSLYSCACVHVGSCTTRKPVILRCVIYTRRNHGYVTLVVAVSVVTNQSRRLQPEV